MSAPVVVMPPDNAVVVRAVVLEDDLKKDSDCALLHRPVFVAATDGTRISAPLPKNDLDNVLRILKKPESSRNAFLGIAYADSGGSGSGSGSATEDCALLPRTKNSRGSVMHAVAVVVGGAVTILDDIFADRESATVGKFVHVNIETGSLSVNPDRRVDGCTLVGMLLEVGSRSDARVLLL